jgi:hypothetical protein
MHPEAIHNFHGIFSFSAPQGQIPLAHYFFCDYSNDPNHHVAACGRC